MDGTWLRVAVAVCVATVQVACQHSESPTEPVRTATSLVVSPGTAQFTSLGVAQQLSATITDQNGVPMVGLTVVWSSSDSGVVSVSPSGAITSVANGTVGITAASGALRAVCMVTVSQIVAAVTLSSTAQQFSSIGDTSRLLATAADANGARIAGATFVWASSDTMVVKVSGVGLVTAVRNGATSIIATSGTLSASATVTVHQVGVAVAILPSSLRLTALGDTTRLAATVTDARGIVVVGANIAWASSDSTTASVSAAGLVTSKRNGSATVSAVAGSALQTVAVVVDQVPSTLEIAPDSIIFRAVGDTITARAAVLDRGGYVIAAAAVAWSVSNSGVTVAASSGLVSAVENGVAWLRASSGTASDSIVIAVRDPSDRTAPILDSLDVMTTQVDVSQAPATVRVLMRARDDLSGMRLLYLEFYGPQNQVILCAASVPGPVLNFDGQCEATIPRYAAAGVWRVSRVYMYDQVGNESEVDEATLIARGLRTRFTVASNSDLTPPILDSLDVMTTQVDVSQAPATVRVFMRARDDLSGMRLLYLEFYGPQNQVILCAASVPGPVLNFDGQCEATIPRYASAGEWRVSRVYMYDQVGNDSAVDETYLIARGFRTRFIVVYPP